MKCKKPFRAGLVEGGCGQCLPCRINRQRLWTIRLILEAGQHEHSSFVTLTYDEQNYPADGSVSVREAQLFLKRLRKGVGAVRYFVVGEYGERTWRAHYHAILFGVRNGCGVEEAWGKGRVHISGVGPESCAYVAGYCLKGLTTERGMRWAERKLRPEFARMSLRPGLGAVAASRIASFYNGKEGSFFLARDGGKIQSSLRQNQKFWPLGRYLAARVRNLVGLDKELLSRERQLRGALELQQLGQEGLNALVEKLEAVSLRSGKRAEDRALRQSLERKI